MPLYRQTIISSKSYTTIIFYIIVVFRKEQFVKFEFAMATSALCAVNRLKYKYLLEKKLTSCYTLMPRNRRNKLNQARKDIY